MPKPVRPFLHGDSDHITGFEPGGFFEDAMHGSLLGTLNVDTKPMTPVDKIQAKSNNISMCSSHNMLFVFSGRFSFDSFCSLLFSTGADSGGNT